MASSSRTKMCKNKADLFFYICGIYTLTSQRSNISLLVKRAYKAYFQVHLKDPKKWASHIVCHNCEEMLQDWTKGKGKRLTFGLSIVWRKRKENLKSDCYFCLANTKDMRKKHQKNIFYFNVPSTIRPVLHSDKFSPPVFNGLCLLKMKKLNLKKST